MRAQQSINTDQFDHLRGGHEGFPFPPAQEFPIRPFRHTFPQTTPEHVQGLNRYAVPAHESKERIPINPVPAQ
jgi:hypothetical protein